MAGPRARKLLGALALAGATGLVILALRPASPTFDANSFARALDWQLRETEAGLHTRVATLSELPRLAAAVATDARTVRDLTQDELTLRPRPGETIAIGQIPKGGPPVVLLVAPDGAAPPPLRLGGGHLHVDGGQLIVSEAIKVVPRERAGELDGVIAVSWPVDLSAISASLAAAGAQAQLVAQGTTLEIGAPATPSSVRRKAFEAGELRVAILAAAPRPMAFAWVGALVLAALGTAAFARRKRAARDQAAAVPAVWTPASGPGPLALRATAATPVGVASAPIGRIGRYDLLRTIGFGGMAQVYLARATGEAGFAKLLAVKVLQPEFAAQPLVVQHFLDEARLAAQLDNPHVVQTVDLGRAGDNYFIAMEYIDGADLLRLVGMSHAQGQPVPLPVALAILRGICDGLQAAHAACGPDGQPLGLVHRDVKSANVFVARSGVVKVGDFGIAKAHHAGWVSRTEIGLVKGTPGYMAPEQRLGLPIDARADLYSVGAIAYELLSGEPVNLDLAVLAAKGQEGWPHLAPLASVRPDIPSDLDAMVMRALSYDRDARFPDCAALEAALESVAAACPPVASDKTIARWVEGVLSQSPSEVTHLAHA